MTTLEIYKAHYEDNRMNHHEDYSKYEWAARHIFDLTTYDGALDEKFVKTIMEVCKVILNRSNFDYIGDCDANNENYIKYILACQIFERFKWLDWGTSIRGAWFERECFTPWGCKEPIVSKDILEEYKWWDTESGEWTEHTIDAVPFTVDNLKDLVTFMEE